MRKLSALSISLLMTSSAMVYAGADHDHNAMNGMQNNKMQSASMSMDSSQGMSKKMSPEMQQKRQAMQAEVIKIMQEPDLAKRQAAMKAHKEKIQAKMMSNKGMKISPQMMQKRQAMQVEIMTITNEPDAAKRQSMLQQHMKKMQGMMASMPISMNKKSMNEEKMHEHSNNHKH